MVNRPTGQQDMCGDLETRVSSRQFLAPGHRRQTPPRPGPGGGCPRVQQCNRELNGITQNLCPGLCQTRRRASLTHLAFPSQDLTGLLLWKATFPNTEGQGWGPAQQARRECGRCRQGHGVIPLSLRSLLGARAHKAACPSYTGRDGSFFSAGWTGFPALTGESLV